MSNLTITNSSNPTETYTFGNRGKRPAWVTAGLAAGTIQLPEGYQTAAEKLASKVKSDAPATEKAPKSVNPVKALEKLAKARVVAENKRLVAKRHLDEETKVVADLDAEIQTIRDTLTAAIASATVQEPAKVETPQAETATAEPAQEAVAV